MTEFEKLFDRAATVTSDAHGRVNLIGEHTDYNGGFVLPTLIPQRTRVLLLPRSDDTVRAVSLSMGPDVFTYTLGAESPQGGWVDFLQGVTHTLSAEGHRLRGFDALFTSDVPVGSGLSSSAAFDVSLMRGLRSAFGLEIDDFRIGQLGQRVENHFVGAHVGIMDPMVCSVGREGAALFLDARSLEYQHAPLPSAAELVVINSGVAHDHSAGDYNTRRAECERACGLLGVDKLRDLSEADLPRVAALPAPLDRRARHVVTENARVLAAVAAMRAGDVIRLGSLFNESHDSQRDDYEVSIPEIDLLVDLARADQRVYGARLTGGGFGGSIVLLVRAGAGRGCAARLAQAYAARSGRQPTILVPA
jgi:galactokinase